MYIITYDILFDFYCVKNQSDALKIKLFQGYVDWTKQKNHRYPNKNRKFLLCRIQYRKTYRDLPQVVFNKNRSASKRLQF